VEPVRPGDDAADSAADTQAPDPLDPGAAATAIVMRGGISLGRFFGIPVRASLSSLLLYYVVAVTTLGRNVENAGHTRNTAYVISAVGAVLLEASVFLHEIGHCLMAQRLGLRVTGLRLWILGGLTQVEPERESPRREYAVAVIGPLVSLMLGSICSAVGLMLHQANGNLAGLTLFWLGVVNGVLAAYNMLPGLPFDGGRVLRAAVWGATHRATTGTRVAAGVGYVAAAGTAAVTIATSGGSSTSNSDSVSYLLPGLVVSAYIGAAAHTAMKSAKVTDRTPLISAGQLARRALTAFADLPLAEALRRASSIGATSVIVTTSDGSPQSLLCGAQVDAIPIDRRPWVPVSSVSRPITDGMVLDARLSGQAVLDALRRHPAGEYLVVEPAGQLLGVLTAIDVAAVLDPSSARHGRPAAGSGAGQ
jgi:Zn-dependent protease